jgi:leucyl aminopeptidase (aminopeptidase T)
LEEAVTKILTVNLGVKKEERVLVFTDLVSADEAVSPGERKRREGTRVIARRLSEAGKGLCNTIYIEFPSVGGHGVEPPLSVWEAAFGPNVVRELRDKDIFERLLAKKADEQELKVCESIVRRSAGEAVDCVVALSNFSTSHTRFRELLTRGTGARYASMPLFEEYMLTGAMSADWNEVGERTVELASRINRGDTVHISTPNGTSIHFSIKGRKVEPDTGMLTEEGSFGNLPAGEAYVAPVEGTAQGTLVLDWAPTRKLKNPVTLKVRDGRVVDVIEEGGEGVDRGEEPFAGELKKKIDENPLVGNIAELGVGTNDKATRPDNILESEKILGTVHMALGDNSTFGGKVRVPFHQDFVFFNPTVEVEKDGERIEILKDGALQMP